MASREFIKIPRILLLISGFWPFPITKNVFCAKIYYVYSRIQLILYVSFIASITINMLILIIKHDQPTRMFSSINVMIIVGEACLKLLVFQAKKIPSMFSHIMTYEQRIENLNDEEVNVFFNNQTIYCRWINCVQMLLTTVSCATYALVAVMQLIRIEDLAFYENEPFMHDLWYPFRKKEHMQWVVFINMKTTTGGFVAFLTIVILLLSQIFILSWSANEISLESSKISDAIFESNWEDYSQRIKAYFITMSMGARKPLGLTAGPFFQMSTNTAISVSIIE
ncbi:hypothetical protein HUJ04_001440 [Dendroctonus ponderosae]|nr:hypothetical protein HUJ04_001440 [Dendroctonus ponderosae]